MKNSRLILAGILFLISGFFGFLTTFLVSAADIEMSFTLTKISHISMIAGSGALILAGLKKN